MVLAARLALRAEAASVVVLPAEGAAMTTEHKPHSTRTQYLTVKNALVAGWGSRDEKTWRDEAIAALDSLEEQVQSLERERDYQRDRGDELLEEKRGLLEQLETLRNCIEEYADLDNWDHVRSPETTSAWQKRGGHPTPWVDAQEALSNPASEPGWISPVQKVIELQEQLESLRRHAEAVRDSWLIIDADDAHLMHSCAELDAFLTGSSPAISPESPCSICGTYGHFTHNHERETSSPAKEPCAWCGTTRHSTEYHASGGESIAEDSAPATKP